MENANAQKNTAAVILGRMKSIKKAIASRENGKKGGAFGGRPIKPIPREVIDAYTYDFENGKIYHAYDKINGKRGVMKKMQKRSHRRHFT